MTRFQTARHAPPRGFTLPEVVFVVLLASLVASIISNVFFQGFRQTAKGTDRLDSIRAFSLLAEAIRKDVANSLKITPPPTELYPEELLIPGDVEMASSLGVDLSEGGKVEYSMVPGTASKASSIQRVQRNPLGETVSQKLFAAGRTRSFKVLHLVKRVNVGGLAQELDHVLVQIDLDSQDPRFPANTLTFFHVFVSDRLPGSSWNDRSRVLPPLSEP